MTSGSTAKLPRLVIAAPQGRSGKTTLTLGLCAALARRGWSVQPFKKGPDYIDPSWLTAAANQPCRTLDPFFLPENQDLRRAFWAGARRSDIAVIEGNHGLYDSSLNIHKSSNEENIEGAGSTAAVARNLKAPILLVINSARMGRSAAAIVLGYQSFEADTPIAGVVLNNVASARHESKLRQAIESACRIPVVGAIPRQELLSIPDRHLGLVPQSEDNALAPAIEACREAAEAHLDLDRIAAIAESAAPFEIPAETFGNEPHLTQSSPGIGAAIGIMRDRAFSFYYPENLEALQQAGASLAYIDALQDERLPAVDALYIGGGFPEMFLDELEANTGLREDIRRKVDDGLPVYAECGGLMFLARRIHWRGRSVEMCGVLPLEVEMQDRPQGHGYILAKTQCETPFFPAGAVLRGHEFHHSRLLNGSANLPTAYHLLRGRGLGGGQDGLIYKNVLAAYTHLHAYAAPHWAPGIVQRALYAH